MRAAVVSLFPEMFDALRCGGVTARALERGLLHLEIWNPREFTRDKHRRVDDRPYGGGPGMVMQVQPLAAAIRCARESLDSEARVIYLSPQGRKLDQAGARELSRYRSLVLVAGRYEGVDERVIERDIDEEWSIGDYVLSGGELAAMVLLDVLARLIPGVLGHADSAREDSFYAGLLDCPHYTRPENYQGRQVPAVLLQGDHQAVARWRMKQALGRTWQRRPDLLEKITLTAEQQALLAEFVQENRGKQS